MIRRAKFSDLKQIIPLAIEAHSISRFAEVPMDYEMAERVCRQALMSSEVPQIGGTFCFVAEGEDGICGMMFGQMSRLYECLDAAIAHDLLFYVDRSAPPRAAEGLLNAFEEWAFSLDGRVMVRISVMDAIVRADLSALWMSRRGYRLSGYVFEKES